MFSYFPPSLLALEGKQRICRYASIVQRIERQFPELEMRVQFPLEALMWFMGNSVREHLKEKGL